MITMAVRDIFAALGVQCEYEPADNESFDSFIGLYAGDDNCVANIQITQQGTFVANCWTSQTMDEIEHGTETNKLALAACDAIQLMRKHGWIK